MTWHLKDRELEKKLIAIDPNFVKTLTDTVEEKLANNWVNDDHVANVELTYNGIYLGTVSFFTNRLDKVPEYNPKAWNEYPKVEPPKHEPLRVEFADKSGTKAFFDDCLREYITAKRIDSPCRYRPWED